MLSTFPIPMAPADEGDCDMMGALSRLENRQSLLREGESLEMTVRERHRILAVCRAKQPGPKR